MDWQSIGNALQRTSPLPSLAPQATARWLSYPSPTLDRALHFGPSPWEDLKRSSTVNTRNIDRYSNTGKHEIVTDVDSCLNAFGALCLLRHGDETTRTIGTRQEKTAQNFPGQARSFPAS